jgi:hypothetical protein
VEASCSLMMSLRLATGGEGGRGQQRPHGLVEVENVDEGAGVVWGTRRGPSEDAIWEAAVF